MLGSGANRGRGEETTCSSTAQQKHSASATREWPRSLHGQRRKRTGQQVGRKGGGRADTAVKNGIRDNGENEVMGEKEEVDGEG